ncbi:MAG: altronate dehydratase [Acidobacteria bacterium]|nr:altronate dehydratase [Acidobacteriota bacterium]
MTILEPASAPLKQRMLQIHPADNVLVALTDLPQGEALRLADWSGTLVTDVPAKHKFAGVDLAIGDKIIMYGYLVGRAVAPIQKGEVITTRNTRHEASAFDFQGAEFHWSPPDVRKWQGRTFQGYQRSDGQVGTANYWLVIPMVFCETRNVNVIKQAFEKELGYAPPEIYHHQVAEMAKLFREGRHDELHRYAVKAQPSAPPAPKIFANLDGIKFLIHEGGCGGTREDAHNLCALFAGYIHHPNVAGATILSLGCQNAQVAMLQAELVKRNPKFDKPLLIFEQQQSGSEYAMLSAAIKETFLALVTANQQTRQPAALSHLALGLECGGSDGFSGISANPAIGHTADILAALGGKAILSEFPELCGVEQELINRCEHPESAQRFINLMRDYAARATAVGSGFDMNPSPGNIKDGLITDAMKSAGAAKKGGTSPVKAVLDYPEYATTPGLNLLCTPGNDVESTTAEVAAGANVVLFTTGLGTPMGNPIVPVVKLATNAQLARRMSDIIDIDCGAIIAGEKSLEQMGEEILEFVINVASGTVKTKAQQLGQDDFIPWKRGVSL